MGLVPLTINGNRRDERSCCSRPEGSGVTKAATPVVAEDITANARWQVLRDEAGLMGK